MPANHPIRRRPVAILVAVVCVVAMAVSAFLGGAAGSGYAFSNAIMLDSFMWSASSHDSTAFARLLRTHDVFEDLGAIAGGGGGLVAGILWCSVVVRLAIRRPGANAALHGCWMGVVASLLATAMLHVPLAYAAEYAAGNPQTTIIGIGVACGVVAGAVVGAICGTVCRWTVARACQSEVSSPHEQEPCIQDS